MKKFNESCSLKQFNEQDWLSDGSVLVERGEFLVAEAESDGIEGYSSAILPNFDRQESAWLNGIDELLFKLRVWFRSKNVFNYFTDMIEWMFCRNDTHPVMACIFSGLLHLVLPIFNYFPCAWI